VAGKELNGQQFGPWIRPVNSRNKNAISDSDRRYKGGHLATVLDILSVPLVRHCPSGHQKENYEIQVGEPWVKKSNATWAQIEKATDSNAVGLWGKGISSRFGHNDKVPAAIAQKLNHSLLLIKPAMCELLVLNELAYGGGTKKRVRVGFLFNGVRYNFVVSDPWVSASYPNLGKYRIPKSRLCISLSEVLNGYAIKLGAAVITPDRVDENE